MSQFSFKPAPTKVEAKTVATNIIIGDKVQFEVNHDKQHKTIQIVAREQEAPKPKVQPTEFKPVEIKIEPIRSIINQNEATKQSSFNYYERREKYLQETIIRIKGYQKPSIPRNTAIQPTIHTKSFVEDKIYLQQDLFTYYQQNRQECQQKPKSIKAEQLIDFQLYQYCDRALKNIISSQEAEKYRFKVPQCAAVENSILVSGCFDTEIIELKNNAAFYNQVNPALFNKFRLSNPASAKLSPKNKKLNQCLLIRIHRLLKILLRYRQKKVHQYKQNKTSMQYTDLLNMQVTVALHKGIKSGVLSEETETYIVLTNPKGKEQIEKSKINKVNFVSTNTQIDQPVRSTIPVKPVTYGFKLEPPEQEDTQEPNEFQKQQPKQLNEGYFQIITTCIPNQLDYKIENKPTKRSQVIHQT
ncbi:Conserved_hypothetical protein [Hexamita inflata]|uniref:Uncharacterized protein n=1 Tax=Hexamita inflata TaxID=28002 RepID=A0ABP1HIA9_9EUKA